MKTPAFPTLGLTALIALAAPPGLPGAEAAAELKVGLGIEKMEIKDAAETFTVAAGTRIYAWAKVTGEQGATVSLSFQKDGKTVFQQELEVPRSPYRTHAYRTFRAGDAGAWTVKALDPDGKELGTANFTVQIQAEPS